MMIKKKIELKHFEEGLNSYKSKNDNSKNMFV